MTIYLRASSGVDFPDDTNVTAGIRSVSGTGTAGIVVTAEEEW